MQQKVLYIRQWIFLLAAVLLAACSSDSEEVTTPVEDCFLDIYVYAPGRPIATRAEVGDVASAEDESAVKTLQIWVFRHSDGGLVSYKDTIPSYLNGTAGQEKFQMIIDRTFADNPVNVDVYVVANAASYVTTTLDETTTRDQLDEAVIGNDSFGTVSPVSRVPDGGLPMSAVLKNQPVSGKFPTLRIGTESEIATLELTRAVSKLRFVFCRITENDDTQKKLVSIDGISLQSRQIPVTTYIIPRETPGYGDFDENSIAFISSAVLKKDIPDVEDPSLYVYETQTAQEYEDLIDKAVTEGHLKEIGPYYLRESNRQLKGTITYTYEENNSESTVDVDFSMAARGDFLRNHTWIVYIYYMDAKIHPFVITYIGMKSWIDDGRDEAIKFYNW